LAMTVDIRLKLYSQLFALMELEQVPHHLMAAQREAEALGEPARLARVLSITGTYYWLTGQHRKAVEFGARACVVAASAGDPEFQAEANNRLAWTWHTLGEYRKAIDAASQSVDLLPDALRHRDFGQGTSSAVSARVWLARGFAELGEFTEAIKWGDEALRIAEAIEHPWTILAACVGAGMARLRKGDVTGAVFALERGFALADPVQAPTWASYIAASLGAAYTLVGRAAQARSLLERAVTELASARLMANQSLRVAWLGEACLSSDQVEASAQHAEHALR